MSLDVFLFLLNFGTDEKIAEGIQGCFFPVRKWRCCIVFSAGPFHLSPKAII